MATVMLIALATHGGLPSRAAVLELRSCLRKASERLRESATVQMLQISSQQLGLSPDSSTEYVGAHRKA